MQGLEDNGFHLVKLAGQPARRNSGDGRRTRDDFALRGDSPVLRGAWVLETLLGTPVPPPPPDVPPLETDAENGVKLRMREKLLQHRANPVLRRLPQTDGSDRLRAGEFRLDGPMAR